MQRTIDETDRRRDKQLKYNEAHNITPTQIVKSNETTLGKTNAPDSGSKGQRAYVENESSGIAADPVVQYMNKEQLTKLLKQVKSGMEKAVKALDFIEAARLRDELFVLEKLMKEK